jgi:UDP-glucose 4-epimerase
MRILITGVAGFIGSNLAVRLLAEKHQVIGIDNLAYGIKEQIPSGVDFHQLDIRSTDIFPLFKKIDAVFHLAAKNCISDCEKDPLETADINIQGFAHVLEAARLAGLPKVIYAESSALYEGSKLFPTPETEVHPQSFYAVSKRAGMDWAETYRRAFGLKTTALRYFCVYGPRQDYRRTVPPLMSAFIIKLLKGEQPTIYGTGQKKRDFVYVDDVNDFHMQCLNDPRTDGETYNLGSGENYSVLEIFQKIQNLLKTSIKPTHKPDLPGEAEITLGDVGKARSIGWSPKINLEEGLKRSIEYIRREVLPSL